MTTRFTVAGVVCIWLILCAMTGLNAQTPVKLLEKALEGPTVPYDGIQMSNVPTANGIATASVRVCGNGAGSELREYRGIGSAIVQILRIGKRMWTRSGDGSWALLPSGQEVNAASTAALINLNYKLVVLPAEKMLGRSVIPLVVSQRHPYQPERKMWIETATGIILKDELYGPNGRLRSSTSYVSCTNRRQQTSLFTPPSKTKELDLIGLASLRSMASSVEVENATGRVIHYPAYLPAGFKLSMYGCIRAGSGKLMPVMRYSDGLAAFTIFERGRGPGRGMHAMKTSDQQAVVQREGAVGNYTLVGDIAANELRKVGDSLP